MNRFAATGLLVPVILEGKTVVIITATQAENRHALDCTLEMMGNLADQAKVSRANGDERVTFPNGGKVVFVSHRSRRRRGVIADIFFLDTGVDEVLDPLELLPHLATGGELVRA